jgi:hypothetical protein
MPGHLAGPALATQPMPARRPEEAPAGSSIGTRQAAVTGGRSKVVRYAGRTRIALHAATGRAAGPRPRSPGRRSRSWSSPRVCFLRPDGAPPGGGGRRWRRAASVHSSPAGPAGCAGPSARPAGFKRRHSTPRGTFPSRPAEPKVAGGASSGCGLRDRLRPGTMPGTSLISPPPDLSPARNRTHLSRRVLQESQPVILQTPHAPGIDHPRHRRTPTRRTTPDRARARPCPCPRNRPAPRPLSTGMPATSAGYATSRLARCPPAQYAREWSSPMCAFPVSGQPPTIIFCVQDATRAADRTPQQRRGM